MLPPRPSDAKPCSTDAAGEVVSGGTGEDGAPGAVGRVLFTSSLPKCPGRKTDLSDCQWLQRLHGAGLLRGSFRPGDAITRLRAMHRQMGNLAQERTRCVQWIQQALDQMNVQVHRAVSDLTGQTGMAIVHAIVAGGRDARQLAALRGKRCRKSEEEFARYLTRNWREEHPFNLGQALELYDTLQRQIAVYEQRLEDEIRALTPEEQKELLPPKHPNPAKEKSIRGRGERELHDDLFRFAEVDLTRIDGISVGTAREILTEVGPDLSAFPGEKHFVSWLRLAPRTAVSGGKPLPRKKSGGMGSNRVAAALRMAAVALQRSHSALGANFRRIARRKGYRVAVFATARKLAQLVYRMLRWGQDYVDIGEHRPMNCDSGRSGSRACRGRLTRWATNWSRKPSCPPDPKLPAYSPSVGDAKMVFQVSSAPASFRRGSFGVETRPLGYHRW